MSVQSGPSPMTHGDGSRTAANFVDCLIGDVKAVFAPCTVSNDVLRDLENRFHATVRMDRRLRERSNKKRRRQDRPLLAIR